MSRTAGPRPPGQLFVVATPIGNLQDFSPRGVETLKQVERIACEDTRHTGRLLHHFGIPTPTISYHEHNEEERTSQLIGWLLQGDSVALVSDAGTPLISDPGYRLIRAARTAGVPVLAVPGPNAAIAALSISGLPSDSFLFLGFPPNQKRALESSLEVLRPSSATLIWYLSPHRLKPTLECFLQVLGNRCALLVREMTKLYENSHWGPLEEILQEIEAEPARGEYTVVLEGAPQGEGMTPQIDVEAYLEGLMKLRGLSRSAAAAQAARELKLPRRDLYRRSLK